MSPAREDDKATKPKSTPPAKQPAPESTKPLAEKIGFADLDLSVEEVDERISPRETNVFDK